MTVNPLANLGRCVHCGKTGPGELFEPANKAGNLACKATTACEIRQSGEDPVYLLGRLLRSLRGELGTLGTRELAELRHDLLGARDESLGGFTGDVRVHLGGRSDSRDAILATEADRQRRARSAAAARGGETRKAAGS